MPSNLQADHLETRICSGPIAHKAAQWLCVHGALEHLLLKLKPVLCFQSCKNMKLAHNRKFNEV